MNRIGFGMILIALALMAACSNKHHHWRDEKRWTSHKELYASYIERKFASAECGDLVALWEYTTRPDGTREYVIKKFGRKDGAGVLFRGVSSRDILPMMMFEARHRVRRVYRYGTPAYKELATEAVHRGY